MDIGPPELLVIAVLLLVLFGGSQLPKLARNLGKAQREFKEVLAESQRDESAAADEAPEASAPEPAGSESSEEPGSDLD